MNKKLFLFLPHFFLHIRQNTFANVLIPSIGKRDVKSVRDMEKGRNDFYLRKKKEKENKH